MKDNAMYFSNQYLTRNTAVEGISLDGMNRKPLGKVEELTLQLLQADSKVEALI